jgi:hypothetical protein
MDFKSFFAQLLKKVILSVFDYLHAHGEAMKIIRGDTQIIWRSLELAI